VPHDLLLRIWTSFSCTSASSSFTGCASRSAAVRVPQTARSLVRLSRTSAGYADWSDSQIHRNRSVLRGTIIQEELVTRLDRFSREWRASSHRRCRLPLSSSRTALPALGGNVSDRYTYCTIRYPIPLSTLSSSPLNSIGQNSDQTKAAVEGRSCRAIPGPAMPQIADPSKQPSPNRLDLQLRHPEGGSGRRPPGPGASSQPHECVLEGSLEFQFGSHFTPCPLNRVTPTPSSAKPQTPLHP
jgi:hypothetical protein